MNDRLMSKLQLVLKIKQENSYKWNKFIKCLFRHFIYFINS